MKPNTGKSLRKAITLTLLLLLSFGSAKAASYVIKYTSGQTTHYLGCNGTSLQDYTVFDATTCVWEGTSGGKWSCNGKKLDYTTTVWVPSGLTVNDDGANFTLGNNQLYYDGSLRDYYVKYSDNTWTLSSGDNNAGTVTAYDGTALAVTPTSITDLAYTIGGTSVVKTFTVTATPNNATHQYTVSLDGGSDSKFEISADGTSWSNNLANQQGTKTFYVRLKETNQTVGTWLDKIIVSANNSWHASREISLSGTVTIPASLTVSPTSITDLAYTVGGTSTAKTFTVTATPNDASH